MNTGMGGANAPPVFSLSDMVYQILMSEDLTTADRYARLINEFDIAHDMDTQNRFWRIQLASLTVNTVYPRQYLQLRNTVAWLSDFRKVILPILLEYNLPQRLSHAQESQGG